MSWASLLSYLTGPEARRRMLALARRLGFDSISEPDQVRPPHSPPHTNRNHPLRTSLTDPFSEPEQLGEVVDRLLPLLEAAVAGEAAAERSAEPLLQTGASTETDTLLAIEYRPSAEGARVDA